MVKSLLFSLNNIRTALRCIESNFFIHFCGMLMKSELQYLSRLNTNECNNDLVKLNVSLERALPILYKKQLSVRTVFDICTEKSNALCIVKSRVVMVFEIVSEIRNG